jgi:uncharacterized iron-regulated protein
MKKITLILSLFTLFAFKSHNTQLTEAHYRIFSVKLGKEVPLSQVVEDMKNADVLIYGEEHNDSVSHYLQAQILTLLYNAFGKNTALSMEMFDRDVQPVMNEYLKGHIREKNFLKDARVWSNYKDYKPMVEFAKHNGFDVVCANAPSRYTNLAGRKGRNALLELPKSSRAFVAPLPYDTASGNYYNKLMGLMGHSPMPKNDTTKSKAPVMSMGGFNLIHAQSLWDATMAYSIFEYLKANKGKKVFQINGRFHSDEGFAIVTQLKNYNKKIKPIVISSGTDDDFPNINWAKHKHLGDFIIITDPSVPRTYK